MAYGARLESVLGASPRGFESPILRQRKTCHRLTKEPGTFLGEKSCQELSSWAGVLESSLPEQANKFFWHRTNEAVKATQAFFYPPCQASRHTVQEKTELKRSEVSSIIKNR